MIHPAFLTIECIMICHRMLEESLCQGLLFDWHVVLLTVADSVLRGTITDPREYVSAPIAKGSGGVGLSNSK